MCEPNYQRTQEIQLKFWRSVLKVFSLITLFFLYYEFWGVCDRCILIVAGASCGGACIGMGFLNVSCLAGVLASLLRGFRLGNEIAHVDIHWKIR